MTYATKKYSDNCQRDPVWRRRHNLVASPRANFHYPRASLKSRERAEMRSKFIQQKLVTALALTDHVQRLKATEDTKSE